MEHSVHILNLKRHLKEKYGLKASLFDAQDTYAAAHGYFNWRSMEVALKQMGSYPETGPGEKNGLDQTDRNSDPGCIHHQKIDPLREG